MRLSLLFVAFLLTGCSEKLTVFTDFDNDYDVRLYSTYRWEVEDDIESRNDPLYYNELNDKRIKAAVDGRLQDAGYVAIPNAELTIHYHIIVRDEVVYPYTPLHVGEISRVESHQQPIPYRQGTLIIDVVDALSRELIWRGYAIGIMEQDRPDLTETMIESAVEKMLENFPRSFNL